MLIFKDVSHIYDDGTSAVESVSLQVEKGEFCVLLGPSGAGKSTLMNMVNGVVVPTNGSIFLGETELTKKNKSTIQQRVAMIHQQLHLIPRLSVLHNVLTGLLPRVGFIRSLFKSFPTYDQRKACELLDEMGLEEKHLFRRASNLSGGQQQRVAIARAFISNPDVVLADEPVASLDPAMSRNVLQRLKASAQLRDTTVVCTLHQMEYALEFSDRLVALRHGKVFFDGHPKDMDEKTQEALYELAKHQTQNQ